MKVSEPQPHPGLWLLDSTPDPYRMRFGMERLYHRKGYVMQLHNVNDFFGFGVSLRA